MVSKIFRDINNIRLNISLVNYDHVLMYIFIFIGCDKIKFFKHYHWK